MSTSVSSALTCWCGETEGAGVGPDYRRCAGCGTMVVSRIPPVADARGLADDGEAYGKAYWLDYQRLRGLPDIEERSRTDLNERCLFWLERLLEGVRPPGRVLEIGCGHGGFVTLLRELGFDALGIELSAWVVDFARKVFDAPVVQGTLDTLDLEPGFACVAAFDVLEHVTDPLGLLRRCAHLLGPDGILLLQTPCHRGEGPEWPMFQKDEHVYLFTEASVRDLLARASFTDVQIRPGLFPYDMWISAATGPLPRTPPSETHDRRVPLVFRALLDLHAKTHVLQRSLDEAERDRADRLRQMEELTAIARKTEAERLGQFEELTAQVDKLTRLLQESETDRKDRLAVIRGAESQIETLNTAIHALRSRVERHELAEKAEAARVAQLEALTAQLEALNALARRAEADRLAQVEELQAESEGLRTQLDELRLVAQKAEADRISQVEELAAHLEAVLVSRRSDPTEELSRLLQESEADRAARLDLLHGAEVQVLTLHAEIRALRSRLERIERSIPWRVYRAIVRRR